MSEWRAGLPRAAAIALREVLLTVCSLLPLEAPRGFLWAQALPAPLDVASLCKTKCLRCGRARMMRAPFEAPEGLHSLSQHPSPHLPSALYSISLSLSSTISWVHQSVLQLNAPEGHILPPRSLTPLSHALIQTVHFLSRPEISFLPLLCSL